MLLGSFPKTSCGIFNQEVISSVDCNSFLLYFYSWLLKFKYCLPILLMNIPLCWTACMCTFQGSSNQARNHAHVLHRDTRKWTLPLDLDCTFSLNFQKSPKELGIQLLCTSKFQTYWIIQVPSRSLGKNGILIPFINTQEILSPIVFTPYSLHSCKFPTHWQR